MLEICDLRVVYPRRTAVAGVTARLGAGATVLVGPNGAGKSSLMRVLAGLQRPSGGTVRLGDELLGGARWQRRVGYLPQEPDPAGGVTAADTVALAGWLKGLRRRELDAAVRAALAAVDLADRANERVRVLSGGMRRRLCFATAVVHRPTLLLLDEPTVGLDPEQRGELCRLVADLAADRVVLMATHLLDDARRVGAAVAVLAEGTLPFVGSVPEMVGAAAARTGRRLDPDRAGDLDLAYLDLVGDGAIVP